MCGQLGFVVGRNILYQVNRPADRSNIPLVDSRPQSVRTHRCCEDVGTRGGETDWATIFGALRGSALEYPPNNTGSDAFGVPRQPQHHTTLLYPIGLLQVM